MSVPFLHIVILFLYKTYQKKHMVFVFNRLGYFNKH